MILTPIPAAALPDTMSVFRLQVGASDPRALAAFDRIAADGSSARAEGAVAEAHRREALALLGQAGMPPLPSGAPARFGWDGRYVFAETEAYVLLHELAHFQLASPQRRRVPDFGLGPGPDTCDRDGANAQARLDLLAREREESAASLLGILWEAGLGQPALASFLDQNWLEGTGRPQAARHFASTLEGLREGGYVDDGGRPSLVFNTAADQ